MRDNGVVDLVACVLVLGAGLVETGDGVGDAVAEVLKGWGKSRKWSAHGLRAYRAYFDGTLTTPAVPKPTPANVAASSIWPLASISVGSLATLGRYLTVCFNAHIENTSEIGLDPW